MALLLAVPAADALSRHRFRGREMVDTVLEFPFIVSPAALGADLTHAPSERRGLGYVPQQLGLFAHRIGRDNLEA